MSGARIALWLAVFALGLGCSGGGSEPRDRPRGGETRAAGEREERAGTPAAETTAPGRERAGRDGEHDDEGGRPAGASDLVSGERSLMSTVYRISVRTDDAPLAHEAIEAALDEVERLGVVLSEWRDDSEISAVNAAAGERAVHVGPDTLENVRAGLDVARWTEGAYDITWAALRGQYLFRAGEARVPDMERVRALLPLVDFHDVLVDEAASTVMLRRVGMAVGLGGIAKGYAVDRAAAILEARGLHDFMIFGGGQVLVRGHRGDRAWRVGIQHPRAATYIGFLEVTDASVATSGDYEHFFIADDGTRWHHIIDLSTGLPARRSTSVTIVAPTGILADGLDTGCFVMGPERCLAMIAALERSGEARGIEAVILDADLRLWATPGTRDRLILRTPLDAEGRVPMPDPSED